MNEEFVPINGQALCEYARTRFGWLRIAENGCGAIAVYNAMGLLGRAIAFLDVRARLHRWYRPRFFGVSPRELKRCFMKLGVTCARTDSLEELHNLLQAGGVAVLTKWNARWPRLYKGAHTVTITFDGEAYAVYNRYSNRDRVYFCVSLEEIIGEGSLIRAYIVVTVHKVGGLDCRNIPNRACTEE